MHFLTAAVFAALAFTDAYALFITATPVTGIERDWKVVMLSVEVFIVAMELTLGVVTLRMREATKATVTRNADTSF